MEHLLHRLYGVDAPPCLLVMCRATVVKTLAEFATLRHFRLW